MGKIKNAARRVRLWIGQALRALGRRARESLNMGINFGISRETAESFRDGYRSVRGRNEERATGILSDLDGSRRREVEAESRRQQENQNIIRNAVATRIANDSARGITTSQEDIEELVEILQRTL